MRLHIYSLYFYPNVKLELHHFEAIVRKIGQQSCASPYTEAIQNIQQLLYYPSLKTV